MYIFAYGSLMCEASLRQTSAEAKVLGTASLKGHQRKVNAISDAFPDVALNIVPSEHMSVAGVVIDFPEKDVNALRQREAGYELEDVTGQLTPRYPGPVYTFRALADVPSYEGKKAYRSYIDICLAGIPEEKHDQWFRETIIDCEILEDGSDPLYKPLT